MLRKSFTLCLLFSFLFVLTASAKIWRLNNNAGVTADFNAFNTAANSPLVAAGDTIYLEHSATDYPTASFTLTKRLVVVGPGYFFDPANTTFPANTGLQAATRGATLPFFRMGNGSNGSKFLGVSFSSTVYFSTSATAYNIVFEKCFFSTSPAYFESASTYSNISFRKCFMYSSGITQVGGATITDFVCENNIFYSAYVSLQGLSGTNNIFRNNSIFSSASSFDLSNTYVANNIWGGSGNALFTNCVIKNNLFQFNQTLPPTATNNQVNLSATWNNVFVGGSTGSLDSRMQLKPGSPASGAGLTVGTVVSPDCGAFGATDPYKLSGIPNIPSIYTLTVPISIPAGSPTMNVTFSTRNNN